ncbi:MAG: SpoIID/LytB domain-containing protein, partial [Actinomycetota bacterium]|nr:SpoIID/LytB domain-containing protein [Actinomycetota bacterium]
VLLADGRRSLSISSRAPFSVRDGKGKTHRLAAGTHELSPALTLRLAGAAKPRALPGPLTFLPGRATLVLDRPYRGQIVVRLVGRGLRAVNSLPLEQYLYGVVPLEIGSSGPAEALKTQAVAARSYALATRRSGDFDLYPDTRSQVYGGVRAERSETTAAVDATARKVVTYAGKVIAAYYFASSGGRTASVEDVWAGARPIPYLVSVADPYDDVCSQHRWGPYVFSGTELARRLAVAGSVVDLRTVVNPSYRVSALVVRTSGRRVSIPGATVRRILGLRSTWFRFGVLSLARPAGAAVFGASVELTGVARGVGSVHLGQRIPGERWARAASVTPRRDGTFSVRTRPRRTADYRLVAGKAASGLVRVPVAPVVRLEEGGEGRLTGTVRPAAPRARVTIQRQAGGRWTTVATVGTGAGGTFVVPPRPAGAYRARAVVQGFVPGVSPTVRIPA